MARETAPLQLCVFVYPFVCVRMCKCTERQCINIHTQRMKGRLRGTDIRPKVIAEETHSPGTWP